MRACRCPSWYAGQSHTIIKQQQEEKENSCFYAVQEDIYLKLVFHTFDITFFSGLCRDYKETIKLNCGREIVSIFWRHYITRIDLLNSIVDKITKPRFVENSYHRVLARHNLLVQVYWFIFLTDCHITRTDFLNSVVKKQL